MYNESHRNKGPGKESLFSRPGGGGGSKEGRGRVEQVTVIFPSHKNA